MAATPDTVSPATDDARTVCAISLLSGMLADVLHEGLGHGALALMTGAQSGVLTTVAWSSAFDSKLVAAGGTLANLAAGILFWIVLRRAKRASVQLRFFLLTSVAFNLLAGTGIFLFFGCHQFRRLGSGDCRFADTLVVADVTRCHRNSGVLRRRIGGGDWAREVRRGSSKGAATAAETHVHPLFLGGTPLGG